MRLLERFKRDTSGSVLILSAVALTVLIMFSGVAIDYARVASFKTRLQKASDSTILMVANRAIDLRPASPAEAKTYLQGNMNLATDESLLSTELNTSGHTVGIKSTGRISMTVMRIFGFDYWDISTLAEAEWGAEKLEIAVSLDASGSMAGTRVTATRGAVLNFLDNLYTFKRNTPRVTDVKVSLVFWDHVARVARPPAQPAWLTLGTRSSENGQATIVSNYANWEGCVAYQGGDPVFTVLRGMDCKFAGQAVYNATLLASLPLMSLSTDANYNYLVDYMASYTSRYNTNNAVGLQLAISSLTPGSNHLLASTETVADFDDIETKKFIIHMTDGENNTPSTDDPRFYALCQDARAKKITVFTILMVGGNRTMLETCATQAGGKFYMVNQASEIDQVFKDIFVVVSSLRLTK